MARGGYTPEQIRSMSNVDLNFISHYQMKNEELFFEKLAIYLGVLWNIDEMAQAEKSVQPSKDKILIPLAAGINPNILKYIKKEAKDKKTPYIGGGEYVPKEGETVKSVEEMDADTFLGMIGQKRKTRG